MHAPTTRFKKAFMEQLLLSLRAAGQHQQASKSSMGLRERRDAVRLSSDVAMALAASSSAHRDRTVPPAGKKEMAAWERALVARHAADQGNEALMRRIMGGAGYEMAAASSVRTSRRKDARCRRIVRRSRRVLMSKRTTVEKRMVKARMQVLRTLVPGAHGLRGFSSLLSETLDYVACLKTQVELMQWLCKGSHSSSIPG